MTIREFIERLQAMDQDMQVLQRRQFGLAAPYYESFDGWLPQYVTVARSEMHSHIYREARGGEEVLTI